MDGQYDFDAEVLQEKQNFLKGLFPKLKTWYVSAEVSPFAQKYGPFPLFWQDMGTWEHYNLAKKVYFIVSEKEPGASFDIMEIDTQVCEMMNPAPVPVGDAEVETDDGVVSGAVVSLPSSSSSVRRKRRWDSSALVVDQQETVAVVAPTPVAEVVPTTAAAPVLRDRWGPPADADLVAAEGAARKKKGSRFSAKAEGAAPAVALTAEAVQQSLVLQMQAQALFERLQQLPREAYLHEQLPPSERPSSPAPIYDSQGRKVNTFEVRTREELTTRRMKLITEMNKLNPMLPTPPDYVKPKPTRRLDIPVEEYPDYNFIGLIIGPRGNTQKRLEQQTGCRISIRGKGAYGRAGKSTANVLTSSKNALSQDENGPLHVHISGDSEEDVEACGKIIAEILVPCEDDTRNEHKQKQLRELALINGTLTMDDFCDICGQRGHRPYECPERNKTFKAANVKCSICGEMSHPTRDCPQRERPPTSEVAMDSEYQNFMAELDGRAPTAASAARDGASPGPDTETGSTSAGLTRSGSATILSSNMFEQFMTPAAPAPVPTETLEPTVFVSNMFMESLDAPPNSTAPTGYPGAPQPPQPPQPQQPQYGGYGPPPGPYGQPYPYPYQAVPGVPPGGSYGYGHPASYAAVPPPASYGHAPPAAPVNPYAPAPYQYQAPPQPPPQN